MSIPEFVQKAYPAPLPLREAIRIINASDEVPDSSKPALKSTALDGVRYATRSGDEIPTKEQALDTDIRPLLSILPAAARAAAKAKGHRSPGDHEARARRFAEGLTGGRSVDRSKCRFLCPPSWQPIVDAIPDRNNANGEMSFLHRCCMVAGVQDSPATLPCYEQIVAAARHISGEAGVRRATKGTLVESRWGRLQKRLSKRKVPARHRIYAKDKLKMVQTVTLPQLVCVGLPLRRREVRALREEWLAAVSQAKEAEHADPHAHPEVIAAENQYFDAALPFIIFSLAIDDGLRRKQYTRGRLGNDANFRIKLERDAGGVPVAIRAMTTHWTGDKRDPAHLKITEKKKLITRRDGRIVRRGFVDHVVLWDLIRHWRPRQLVLNGAIVDLSAYVLKDDLRTGMNAQFPSGQDVYRPEKVADRHRGPVRSRVALHRQDLAAARGADLGGPR